MIFRIV